ncbi:hypothetical protein CPU12_03010 [Malaciobacter molluscorum LMG 25693]|uniref:TonB-dependent siderophore receptor n=1 Tax=Malaciobacter molluscorum LMG 25693 TaxID=870501 RepID=A0A2G1DKA3_9BACT|nr:TonB-dependent receptor [Malaciobacter molluscorum]AXX91408.1 TonB-dependent siderophore receptor [Malaciobacter molluscorum LMG 25693]PHO18844.1 hypothetical protein CPU12_03010 [Malaciobacter molluscorum LMG 25693]
MKKHSYKTLLLTTLISVSTANSIYAKDNQNLGDVIIQGSKLERSLQETTSSIQVFNDIDFLNSSSLNDMYDIFEQTSNINRSGKYGFNIRGISTVGIAGTYMGPRTIDVSIDGVSQGSNASKQGAISTWDMQQVEVIKGPQSTTQGRNALAGAVVLKTKDPEFIPNGAVQVDYGTHNNRQFSVMQTGPITDNLAFRLSVDHKYSGGFVTNKNIRGDKFNESEITNVRGKLLYKFDNDATVLLNLSKLKYDDSGNTNVTKDRKSLWNSDGHYNTDAVSHSIEIDYPINENWSMKSITSFTDETLDRLSDFDKLDGNALANMDRRNKSINQEIRFNYKTENSKSVIGLYHSQGKGTDDRKVTDLNGATTFGVPGLLLSYQQDLEEKFKNSAIYFNTDYYLTDNLTLILGARLDRDTRENSSNIDAQRTTNLGGLNPIIDSRLAALARGDIDAKKNSNNFLPKLGFNYKWNDNIHTGFVYSKGYRPGGMSVNPISALAKEYEAEFTNNYELSFKSLWLDKRLSLNANIFYTTWKDQQVSEQGASSSPFDINVVNAGKSTLKGIELDSKYQLNSEIDLYANIGYLKATYDEYEDRANDYKGNELIKNPKVTGNIGANYRNSSGYFIGGNINYVGSQYGDSANERKIDSYYIANVKTGYEKDDWALYVYANNLFDKNYEINNYGSGEYEMGDQRVVGINFRYYW